MICKKKQGNGKKMSDLIDRKAAIDVVRWWYKNIYGEDAEKWICESIENLPSEQPEIIRCKDCLLRYTSCPMVVRHGNALLFFSKDEDFCSYGKGKEDA